MPQAGFVDRLRNILSKVSSGVGDFAFGPQQDPNELPSEIDMLGASMPENPHPQGFVEQLQEFGRKRSRGRIDRLGMQKQEQERQTDLEAKEATTEATRALAGSREATSQLTQAKTQAQGIKNLIEQATSADQISMVKGRIDVLKSQAQENMASAQEAMSRAGMMGSQTEHLKWQERFNESKQAFDEFERLEKMELANKEQDLKRQRLTQVDIPNARANVDLSGARATQARDSGSVAEERRKLLQAQVALTDARRQVLQNPSDAKTIQDIVEIGVDLIRSGVTPEKVQEMYEANGIDESLGVEGLQQESIFTKIRNAAGGLMGPSAAAAPPPVGPPGPGGDPLDVQIRSRFRELNKRDPTPDELGAIKKRLKIQ